MDLRGNQNRGELTPLFSQTNLYLKRCWRPTEGFLPTLRMKKLENTNFNSPASTGRQRKVGLGQNGAIIDEETVQGGRVRAIPACGASLGLPSNDSLACE